MKKRILSLVLALCLALSLAPAAFAANIVDSGTCGADADGSNIAWTLDADGNLTVCCRKRRSKTGRTSSP